MERSYSERLISVVTPLYGEGENVANFAQRIAEVFSREPENFELILIDDGSSDGTWAEISRIAKTYPVRGVRLSRNFGKEAAISAGLDVAKGDAILVMDGDLQHPPDLISDLLMPWRAGEADVVEAIKSHRGKESASYRTGSSIFYFIMNRLSGFDLANASDFKLLDRKAADAMLAMEEKNPFFRGMSAWVGFRRVRIPFEVGERFEGQSRWSFFRLLKLSLDAITGFSTLPLHLVTLLGLVFMVFAVLLGAQTLYMKLSGRAVSGFSTVILLQLIIGSSLMISLGMIGEYIARIFQEVKRRPRYVIAERLDSDEEKSPRT